MYELKIALRFLKSGKSQTAFIILGITLGVAVQIFLGSLISSLKTSLIDETIGNSSHITIQNEEDSTTSLLQQSSLNSNLLRGNYYPFVKNLNNWSLIVYSIKDDERVTAISPTLQGTALVKGAGKNKSVQIKGINVEDADSIYDISNRLIDGNSTVEGNNILIGKGLSTDLGITSGQFVSILLPSGEVVQLLVSGIFDLENETINSSLVFMDLKRAQKLFKSGNGISTIEVQIKDPFQADVVSNEWKNQMTGVKIDQWKEQNQQLLSALSSQSSSTYTIQIFVIVAVTFGLSSVLAVSVVQKSKEIGILKAMGTTSRSASRIFILQGLMLGFIGSMVGVLFGILLIKVFVFFTQGSISFTIVYEWQSIFVIAAISIVAGVLASFIPARRSANLNPMEAIKNG
jgi:lipoprotein-releasing system permease protein